MCVIRVRLAVSPAYQAERTFAHRTTGVLRDPIPEGTFVILYENAPYNAGILRLVVNFFFSLLRREKPARVIRRDARFQPRLDSTNISFKYRERKTLAFQQKKKKNYYIKNFCQI